jgi:hypothetical protein
LNSKWAKLRKLVAKKRDEQLANDSPQSLGERELMLVQHQTIKEESLVHDQGMFFSVTVNSLFINGFLI